MRLLGVGGGRRSRNPSLDSSAALPPKEGTGEGVEGWRRRQPELKDNEGNSKREMGEELVGILDCQEGKQTECL